MTTTTPNNKQPCHVITPPAAGTIPSKASNFRRSFSLSPSPLFIFYSVCLPIFLSVSSLFLPLLILFSLLKPLKMFRISNNLVGILNFITFLLSIPILGGGIWLSTRASSDCEKFLDKPIIAIGIFLMIVSLAGLIGACCRVTWLLWVYLLVMFLLIVLLFCFTIFAFVVTNKGAGEVVSERGYKEYRLGDYSNWLQKRVNNNKNWRKIKSCLQDSKICDNLEKKNFVQEKFFSEHLSPIQSGCCKPPTACNFTYQSATQWDKPAGNVAAGDCTAWGNDKSVLCYNCQSCKAGVLANLKNDWKKVAIVNIIFLIFLIIVYSIGCCAFRNNREDNAYPRYKGYP